VKHMNTNTKIAVLAGGTVIIGIAAYAITQAMGNQTGKRILQIQASEGGTTDPAPSPSGIFVPDGQSVTITAKPNSGYTIGNWLLDGVELGNPPSIQVTMNINHAVIVTFWQGGEPPPSYPVAITNMDTVTATDYLGGRIDLGALNLITNISVHGTDQYDNWDSSAQYPMRFKVIDSSGKGVPNIPVDLYVGVVPDNSKYKGYLALNVGLHPSTNPLRINTDQNGIATVNVAYQYGINDNLELICRDADLGVWVATPPGRYIAWNGSRYIYNTVFVSKDGGGITGQRPSMGNFFLNTVYAKIATTSIPAAQGLVYCGFSVKWL